MTNLKPQTVVRVRQLIHPFEYYDGRQGMNKRPPKVGDMGRVLQFLHVPERPVAYAVESIDSQDGAPIWFGAFSPEELEPVAETPNPAAERTGAPPSSSGGCSEHEH
jgi:hypothetical protein